MIHSYVMLEELDVCNYCKHCKMHRYHRSISLIDHIVR